MSLERLNVIQKTLNLQLDNKSIKSLLNLLKSNLDSTVLIILTDYVTEELKDAVSTEVVHCVGLLKPV